ncbi:MAG: hypothetical protein IKC63_02220, partial [Clostridia bacterium]|nr:hypothetical protein [Clostridia bacterium]
GQAVKTPPFHGGNMGSIPVRVTKKDNIRTKRFGCYLFIQAAGLAWNQCASALYGIAKGVWHHASPCGLITYATSSQFHAPTSCGFHPRLWRDLDPKGERYGKIIFA